MSKVREAKGSCLCNSVTIEANSMSLNVDACHCSMCQKWSGGPFLTVDCNNKVKFYGRNNITVFNSSVWAERAFCSKCGTHLYYRLKQNDQYIMPVGLFEPSNDFNFELQIFIDEKPSYYCFSNETKNMTGEEVFAQFAQNI